MDKWDEILERDLKQNIDDKIEAWKSVPRYTGFTGAVSSPLTKAVRKFFEDAYVPLDTKEEKTFLEQVVEIDDED